MGGNQSTMNNRPAPKPNAKNISRPGAKIGGRGYGRGNPSPITAPLSLPTDTPNPASLPPAARKVSVVIDDKETLAVMLRGCFIQDLLLPQLHELIGSEIQDIAANFNSQLNFSSDIQPVLADVRTASITKEITEQYIHHFFAAIRIILQSSDKTDLDYKKDLLVYLITHSQLTMQTLAVLNFAPDQRLPLENTRLALEILGTIKTTSSVTGGVAAGAVIAQELTVKDITNLARKDITELQIILEEVNSDLPLGAKQLVINSSAKQINFLIRLRALPWFDLNNSVTVLLASETLIDFITENLALLQEENFTELFSQTTEERLALIREFCAMPWFGNAPNKIDYIMAFVRAPQNVIDALIDLRATGLFKAIITAEVETATAIRLDESALERAAAIEDLAPITNDENFAKNFEVLIGIHGQSIAKFLTIFANLDWFKEDLLLQDKFSHFMRIAINGRGEDFYNSIVILHARNLFIEYLEGNEILNLLFSEVFSQAQQAKRKTFAATLNSAAATGIELNQRTFPAICKVYENDTLPIISTIFTNSKLGEFLTNDSKNNIFTIIADLNLGGLRTLNLTLNRESKSFTSGEDIIAWFSANAKACATATVRRDSLGDSVSQIGSGAAKSRAGGGGGVMSVVGFTTRASFVGSTVTSRPGEILSRSSVIGRH